MAEFITGPGEDVAIHEDQDVEMPRRYRVLLHNDDYTTMEFVVVILEHVFRKNTLEAMQIMMNVHKNGMGVAGVYVKSIAESKMVTVHRMAQKEGFPLRCSMEPE